MGNKETTSRVEPLAEEIAFYEQIKSQLLEHNAEQFALIKGRELIGTFTTADEAYAEGVKRFGNVPMLIKQILKGDEAGQSIPALTHGLIGARS